MPNSKGPFKPYGEPHVVPDEGIKAYEQPYPPLITETREIAPREVVHVITTRGAWAQIAVNGEIVGWVEGSLLRPPIAPPPAHLASAPTIAHVPSTAFPAHLSASARAAPAHAQRVIYVRPDVFVGAIGAIGIAVSAFVDWVKVPFGESPSENAFEVPLRFLFDSETTSRDPRLGVALIVIGVLGLLACAPRLHGGVRVLLGLAAITASVLYFAQVADLLSETGAPGGTLDYVGAGPWVSIAAGVVLMLSPLFRAQTFRT